MTKAPERIWATTGLYYDYSQNWTEGEWDNLENGGVKYIRADLTPSPEAFQQMREALEKIENIGLAWSHSFEVPLVEARAIASAALKAAEGE